MRKRILYVMWKNMIGYIKLEMNVYIVYLLV